MGRRQQHLPLNIALVAYPFEGARHGAGGRDCAGSDALRRVLESGVSDANAATTGKPSGEVPKSSEPASGNDRP
jgi:hypothetical protein